MPLLLLMLVLWGVRLIFLNSITVLNIPKPKIQVYNKAKPGFSLVYANGPKAAAKSIDCLLAKTIEIVPKDLYIVSQKSDLIFLNF